MWASSSTRQTVGPAGEDRVEVHLAEGDAAVLDLPGRDHLEVADLLGRLGPAVGLDEADRHVDALPLQPMPLAEHGVGLADAGREAEVDLEPAPLLAADQVEELLGGRASGFGRRPWYASSEGDGLSGTPSRHSTAGVAESGRIGP